MTSRVLRRYRPWRRALPTMGLQQFATIRLVRLVRNEATTRSHSTRRIYLAISTRNQDWIAILQNGTGNDEGTFE